MPASQVCKFNVASSSSSLSFDGKSTLHAVHGTASQLTGSVTAALEDGGLVLDPSPTMHVEFPVERLSSGNSLQDKETWKLLDSKRNPTIMADLRNLTPTGGAAYHAAGDITMSGRRKSYEGDLTIKVDKDRMVVDGTLVVDIRDFGLQPPRLLMVTVQPQVTVKLHLVAVLDMGAT
jgi:polyisoprenoid-binding protein YceI